MNKIIDATNDGLDIDIRYKTPSHLIWLSIIQRCDNINHKHYHRYGGRGIKVCQRWNKFNNFFEDMGERPDGCCLYRIDNDGGYSTDNCEWITAQDNRRNKSSNRIITHNGITQCLTAWAEDLDMGVGTLRYRLDHWSIEKALTTPSFCSGEKMVYDFYLAGGMRGYQDQNRPMFMSFSELLRKKGYTVWNPAENEGTLTHATFADCMILDLTTIINSCQGIVFLPGWRDSLGANIEAIVSFAVGHTAFEAIIINDTKNDKGTDIKLSVVDLNEYRLPYLKGNTRRFDPHKCELDSFTE